jgi:F-type H+-transporting ATPase subunit epsilon
MRLSITTPRGALVDTEVEEVTAPGLLGELGILPGHVPLMTALKPGVLVYRTKDHTGVVAVGQGFLQVAPVAAANGQAAGDRVLVLVYHAVAAGGVDRVAAESDLKDADLELSKWKRELDGEYQALLVRRDWAAARVDATARAAGAAH